MAEKFSYQVESTVGKGEIASSKLKEFADENFKFDENGRRFFEWVESIVGKAEIARYEQFLLSNSVFKRLALQTRKNQGLLGKG